MTGKQHAVMWLGLTLIITRMFTTHQWSSIWSAIDSGGKNSGSISGIPGSTSPDSPLPGILPPLPGVHIPNPAAPKKH